MKKIASINKVINLSCVITITIFLLINVWSNNIMENKTYILVFSVIIFGLITSVYIKNSNKKSNFCLTLSYSIFLAVFLLLLKVKLESLIGNITVIGIAIGTVLSILYITIMKFLICKETV